MPRTITQYRVFIGSPGGLEAERKKVRALFEKFNRHHARPQHVEFEPVGWEDTVGGAGRPQHLINEDLKTCDFGIFVYHNRWGSPTGNGDLVGTEEEWNLAEQLYSAKQIRNMALFFKGVTIEQMKDPGDQLKKVMAFREKIISEKKYLFESFSDIESFSDHIDRYLGNWFRQHGFAALESLQSEVQATSAVVGFVSANADPGFDFWFRDARALSTATPPAHESAVTFAKRAFASASSDFERASALDIIGLSYLALNALREAQSAFEQIVEILATADAHRELDLLVRGMFNRALTLGRLDRSDEAIVAYDALLVRFANVKNPKALELSAKALANKGLRLGNLGRNEESIAVYDELIARFSNSGDSVIREQLAKAFLSKGSRLLAVGKGEVAMLVFDEMIDRFKELSELKLREQVARAMLAKADALIGQNSFDLAIATYDQCITTFEDAKEPPLEEMVAKALISKGDRLLAAGQETAFGLYDEVVTRFDKSREPAVREQQARALIAKADALHGLSRWDEADITYKIALERFAEDKESRIRRLITSARSKQVKNLRAKEGRPLSLMKMRHLKLR